MNLTAERLSQIRARTVNVPPLSEDGKRLLWKSWPMVMGIVETLEDTVILFNALQASEQARAALREALMRLVSGWDTGDAVDFWTDGIKSARAILAKDRELG